MKGTIKPNAYSNHRVPHCPWYILDDYSGVKPDVLGVVFEVEERDTQMGWKYYLVISSDTKNATIDEALKYKGSIQGRDIDIL